MKNVNYCDPLVSILIPVFNRQNTIEECIKSALSQSYSNFEVVISDNNSDDKTWNICEQYSTLDSRVRIFRNDVNIGPVKNWRRCAQEAKGTLIKVLFSDDLLLPNCLKDMVNAFDSRAAFVYCAAYVGESLEKNKIRYFSPSNEVITSVTFINRVILGDAPVSPGAILFRASDFIENLHIMFPSAVDRPYALHGAGPDVLAAFLTTLNYDYVVYCNRPLVFFKMHAGSITIGPQSERVEQGYISAISWFLKKYYGVEAWRRYLALQFLKKIIRMKFTSPGILLKENEGANTISEKLLLLVSSVGLIMRKFSRKSVEIIRSV